MNETEHGPLPRAVTPSPATAASGPVRPERNEDLVQQIKDYADKLAADEASRGDLKIISRSLRELRYAFKVFRPYRQGRKVAVFGSARTPATAPAYRQAAQLGRAMADAGWMVVTGAAQGIMEAAHVGAGREHAMGVNILLPFEQASNAVIAGDPKLVYMKYFFTRKLVFVKECDAVVCLPGGFGTMDEALEVLTLLQTGKRDPAPLVLLDEPGGDYWSSVRSFVTGTLLRRGLIGEEDLHLCRITDDYAAAVAEVLGFFRRYHSMRYVKERLVFRLQQPLSAAALAGINADFADIVESGGFDPCGALPEEEDEPHVAALPRLAFVFNRRNFGRLRQLINRINGDVPV